MNPIKKGLAIVISMLFGISMQAQTIDAQKSLAKFSVSNMKFRTVEGTFTGMKGDVIFDEENLLGSSFNVCLDAATVNTKNEKRDGHLRNADFFDVEKYPEICFRSTTISKTAKGFVTQGQLDMHGVAKEISINFTYDNGEFIGKLSLDRFDYKVGSATGKFMVGEVINIEIIAVVN